MEGKVESLRKKVCILFHPNAALVARHKSSLSKQAKTPLTKTRLLRYLGKEGEVLQKKYKNDPTIVIIDSDDEEVGRTKKYSMEHGTKTK